MFVSDFLWNDYDSTSKKMGSGWATCLLGRKCQRQFGTCESKICWGLQRWGTKRHKKKKTNMKGFAFACLLLFEY